jgi:Xaa-Pro dipeptidase
MKVGTGTRVRLAIAMLALVLATSARAGTTIRFIPHADLANLVPMGSTANIVKMHAFDALREGMLDSHRVAEMPNVASGPRTARAHITWGHLPISRGELITVEPAACVRNYHAPVYKIMSVGSPEPEALRMFDVCRQAFEAGWAAVRPGMSSNDAASINGSSIRRAGYEELMVTRPAYSIGIAFPPGWGEDNVGSIRTGDEQVLEAGMCFHICPCLYKDGLACVAASMPAVLTENGFESLSRDQLILTTK